MRILLIEDAPRLGKYVKKGLEQAGFAVDWSTAGEDGQWRAESGEYDAIVLDLMLPDRDGLQILRDLRAEGDRVHVLILTARDTVEHRVEGLQAGADDYLIKPFAMEELVARVRALVRRSYGDKSPLLRVGRLTLDETRLEAFLGERVLKLAPREYRLLELLARRHGEVVSRSEIEAHSYDEQVEPSSNVVDAAVYALRKQLDAADEPSWITTRRGHGYQLEDPQR